MPTTYTEPRSDAYTGLLAISLGAMVLGSIILFMDFNQYDKKPTTPPAPKLRPPEGQPVAVPPPPGDAAPVKEPVKEKEKEKEKE